MIILRGVSGSGKSRLAQSYASERTLIVSADHFFTNRQGEYRFDPAKLGQAHNTCLRDYAHAVSWCGHEWERIVVDNTNCSITDIAPYVALALAYGSSVSIIQIEEGVTIAASRNVHGVPIEAIGQQAIALHASMRQWPSHWPKPTIIIPALDDAA